MLGWKKHKLESRLLGEISITSDMQMTPPLWQKLRVVGLGQSTVARESKLGHLSAHLDHHGHRCCGTLSRGPRRWADAVSAPSPAQPMVSSEAEGTCWGWKRWLETVLSAPWSPLEPDQVGISAASPQSECNWGRSLQRLHLWD